MILAVLLTLACKKKDAGEDLPPEICQPSSAWSSGMAYKWRTEEWGLSGLTGVKMSAADLDGDGYPDLVVQDAAPFQRSDFESGAVVHRVLMNVDDGAGGRTFADRTEESGLFTVRDGDGSRVGRASQIHVFADVDNDGDLDVFAGAFQDRNNDDADPGDRSEILLNDGNGHFTLAPASDLWMAGGYATAGASFTDADGDGRVDLWITGWYQRYGYLKSEQDHLFLGEGDGRFRMVTDEVGLTMEVTSSTQAFIDGTAARPAYGATSCDLDGDAWPDLLATNYGRAWNQQWMNRQGSFEDTSMSSGFAADDNLDYSDNQYYACYCEVNGPCDPDPGSSLLGNCSTYASYWTPGWDDQPNRLAGNSFTTACGDLDNDGDNDLVTAEIVHWHIGQSSDPTEILLNDGQGGFTRPGVGATGLERDWPSDSWNAGDIYAAMADLDLDGWKDLIVASTDYPDTRLFVWRQVEAGVFQEVAEEWGVDHPWPAGLVVADFDRDGDLDLVMGSSNARSGSPWESHELHLYENQLGPGNALRLSLRGQSANRAGVGARVEVQAGDKVQTYEVSGGYGHFGMQNDTVLTIGLDEACTADRVEVVWPGGATDSFGPVRAGYDVTLVQGGRVEYAGWGGPEE